jgi:hypothetical protein
VTSASIISLPEVVLLLASLAFVGWAIADVARRPSSLLSTRAKVAWIVAMGVGWFFLGIVGVAVAVVYLVGPRRRLNAGRGPW